MSHLPLLIFTLENPEWLIILAIVVLLFGGSRLAGLGGALGQSIREFKRAARGDDEPAPGAPFTSAPIAGGSITSIDGTAPQVPSMTPIATAGGSPVAAPATAARGPLPADYLPGQQADARSFPPNR